MALAGVFIASLAINNIANMKPCPHLLLRAALFVPLFRGADDDDQHHGNGWECAVALKAWSRLVTAHEAFQPL